MWRLTVYQPKKYKDWETEQEIRFEADLVDLQHLIMSMANTKTKARFTLEQVEEGEEE